MTDNFISRLSINEFNKSHSGILILDIVELSENYAHLLSIPRRPDFYQLIFLYEGKADVHVETTLHDISSYSVISIAKNQVTNVLFEEKSFGFVLLFDQDFIYEHPDDMGLLNNLKNFDSTIDTIVLNSTQVLP